MKFLLQSKVNEIKDVELFIIKEILDRRKREGHSYIITSDPTELDEYREYIPVGDLNYVRKHLKRFNDVEDIRPIEVPIELRKDEYLKRSYKIVKKEDLPKSGQWFIKNIDKLKKFSGTIWIYGDETLSSLEEGNYLVSNVIDIKSEYRCFIQNKRIMGIKHYDGDFAVFPDMSIINKMVIEYKDSPYSYTLDIGVTNKLETIIIEVHNFISIGTYGFDESELIWMYRDGYNYEVDKGGKKYGLYE